MSVIYITKYRPTNAVLIWGLGGVYNNKVEKQIFKSVELAFWMAFYLPNEWKFFVYTNKFEIFNMFLTTAIANGLGFTRIYPTIQMFYRTFVYE